MYSPLSDTSELLKQHAAHITDNYKNRDLIRQAAEIKSVLLQQATMLTDYIADSERHKAINGIPSLQRMLFARKMNSQSIALLEKALLWKVAAERRQQIIELRSERKSLNQNNPRCKVIDHHIEVLEDFIAAVDHQRKYSPDQPRVPAGNPDGGQWTSESDDNSDSSGSGSSDGNPLDFNNPFQIAGDGGIFENREGLLPDKPYGYYTITVIPTPGTDGPGPQRVITGSGGERYYTPDHYKTFELL